MNDDNPTSDPQPVMSIDEFPVPNPKYIPLRVDPRDAVAGYTLTKNQMQPPSKYIWVTFSKIGYHRYPAAPDDVAYLAHPHRHKFGFKVKIEVFHDDREIEFHQFLNWLVSLFDDKAIELDYQSCEMLAESLGNKIIHKYPGRNLGINVDEDGECGAELKWKRVL